jgi:predicted esterase
MGGGAFAWRSAEAVKNAIARALRASEAKYPGHVAEGPRVYAGFSQGAILGASVVEAAPEAYPRVVFLEGLGDIASRRFTRAFKANGGQRIVLACSQAGCEGGRRAAKVALDRAGIDAKVVYAGAIGHTINEPVIAAMREAVPWLLEGDALWSTP